jgi:integrase
MIDADHSRSHINAQINRIKRMFKWGVAEELIPPLVFDGLSAVTGLRRGRCDAREMAPVLRAEDDIVAQTLPWMPPVVADMVRLQRLTGMRPAEVCLLRPCDLDRTDDVWVYGPATHKTEHHGRPRNVFLGPHAQAVHLRYLARCG